jgi:hypothetical protein
MVNGALNGKTIILTLQNYNILGTLSSLSPIFFFDGDSKRAPTKPPFPHARHAL